MIEQPCKVLTPKYEKSRVKAGIAHFGPGNFFRGHLAVIMDRYMDHTGDLEWGITGITLRDPEKAEKLARQSFNYHVVERDGANCVVRDIRSLKGIFHAPHDKEGVIKYLASPDIKLITMTITQKGYVDPEGGFEPGDPQTVADYIVHALDRRRKRGDAAPTLMSCDNITNNGTQLKKAVLDRAQYFPGLVDWINDNVKFPDTMVDRIVPATREEDISWLFNKFGIDDPQAIFTEPFRQLVVQNRFSGPFPKIEHSGIKILPEMADYETMKIRMLNGVHFAVGIVGTLAGYTHIDEALKDPLIKKFAEGYMAGAAASLNPIEGIDFNEYSGRLFGRFDNPFMKDELVRLARNGSDKLRLRCLDIARDLRATHQDPHYMVFTAAAWAHYIKGVNGKGEAFDILDDRAKANDWPHIVAKMTDASVDKSDDKTTAGKTLAQMQSIFGVDMAEDTGFRTNLGHYYARIGAVGVKQALSEMVDNRALALSRANAKTLKIA